MKFKTLDSCFFFKFTPWKKAVVIPFSFIRANDEVFNSRTSTCHCFGPVVSELLAAIFSSASFFFPVSLIAPPQGYCILHLLSPVYTTHVTTGFRFIFPLSLTNSLARAVEMWPQHVDWTEVYWKILDEVAYSYWSTALIECFRHSWRVVHFLGDERRFSVCSWIESPY